MSQQLMRPKARGIIVLVKSNQLVTKISRLNIFRKLKLDLNPLLPPKDYKYGGRFSLLVSYNIQPTRSSTNQNAALMIDHYLDFTKSTYPCCYRFQNQAEKASEFVGSRQETVKSFKDCAYYCYCAYVLRISRYSDFLSPFQSGQTANDSSC